MMKLWSFILSQKRNLLVLFTAIFNRRTPKNIRLMIIAAFVYLISPIDFLPDVIPGLGLLDDALIVPSLLMLAQNFLPQVVREDCERKADFLGPKMPFILAGAGILLVAWTIFVLMSIYNFIFN